jgi:esterase/lipase superfamily enzyme
MTCLRLVLALATATALVGCTLAPPSDALRPIIHTTQGGGRIEILVASTRLRGADAFSFSNGRSHLINYQSVALALPPGRGTVAGAGNGKDAVLTAALPVLSNDAISERTFEARAAKSALRDGGEVTLYVHGFNTTHEKAVLRLGQIAVDAGVQGAVVAFSWPSRGRFLDYLTDRESATFSRDRLETVLRQLSRQKAIRRINVLAHSMGAFLTMETLRQAALRGDGEFGGKLNAVVLAAPDIDLDVFRTQLEVIGKRPKPTILLISSDDTALKLSRFLSGDVERVGGVQVDSPEARAEIMRLGLTIIDLTKVRADSHGKFFDAPQIIRHVGTLIGERNSILQGRIQGADEQARVFSVDDSR